MKKKLIIFLIFGIVFIVFAQDVDEIISKTLKNYENLSSFYAEFVQIYCDSVQGICQNYEGKMYFLKPNFFRMEFKKPKQVYVGDSVSLWIYLPEENRAIRQNLGQMPFAISPDIFLKDYEEKFNAEFVKEDKENYEISLTPKEQTDIYKKITVKIHNKKFAITSIAIIDEIGSESKFNFDKIEINKKISKNLFQFNPPEGTKIDEY